MNLFFNKKPKTTPKDAIILLRENVSMLVKRETHLKVKYDTEEKNARANVTRNKRAAVLSLKRMRMLREEMERLGGSRMSLEAQVMAIEGANVNLETMKAMKKGTEAMKSIHKDLDIDKVDQTMDDIRDQMDLANEVSEAISRPEMFGVDLNDDELNAELEELEQEELDKQLLRAEKAPIALPSTAGVPAQAANLTAHRNQLLQASSTPVSLPNAPTTTVSQAPQQQLATTESEDELEELSKQMRIAS
ncbi:ESCRT-III subunit protein snf7 [Coemansia sp. RSA 988]|nr:ESCRT-III subunit protein snf7 [Coemansia sp. RSA 988]